MKPISLRALYQQFHARGLSMRRRFVLYILLVLFAVLAILMLLLNVFGVLRPAEDELAQTLTQQLDYSGDHISTSMEHLAAQATAMSDELAGLIGETGVPFEELNNDQDALLALQTAAYDTVYSYMRRSSCSGAFYFLNATVNSALSDTYYDGIYLKYANLSSDTTVRNSVRMYRGSAHVARENDINLHSTWEFELKAGTFPPAGGGAASRAGRARPLSADHGVQAAGRMGAGAVSVCAGEGRAGPRDRRVRL